MGRRVVIHRVPDLDAIGSVAALQVPLRDVLLLPAGATELPPGWEGAEVLDHPLQRRRADRAAGERFSTLAALPEASGWDPRVLREVEQSVVRASADPAFSLQEVLDAVRSDLIAAGYRGRTLDVEVLRTVGSVMRGLALCHQMLAETRRTVEALDPWDEGTFRMAVLPRDARLYHVAEVLARQGIALSVYQSAASVGVTRHDGYDAPDLGRLRPHLPGWFVHPRGCLACWGSAKAPVDGPPPAGTPQDQQELAALVHRTLGCGQ